MPGSDDVAASNALGLGFWGRSFEGMPDTVFSTMLRLGATAEVRAADIFSGQDVVIHGAGHGSLPIPTLGVGHCI